MRHLSRFQLGRVGLVVAAVTLGTSTAVAQARQPGAAPRDTSTRPIRDTLRAAVRDSLRPSTRDFLSMVETPPVVSRHSIRLHGSTLSYTATTGTLTFTQSITSRTFSIPILSAAAGLGNQTINLTISTPTGQTVYFGMAVTVMTLAAAHTRQGA